MYQFEVKKFKSIALCALMIASLTLGGALAATQFPKDECPLPEVVRPMDEWPTVYGQT